MLLSDNFNFKNLINSILNLKASKKQVVIIDFNFISLKSYRSVKVDQIFIWRAKMHL